MRMAGLSLVLFMLVCGGMRAQEPGLDSIRKMYLACSGNSSAVEKLYGLLSGRKDHLNPVETAYEGSVRAMMAREVFLPTSKYRYFSEGRDLIEKAIIEDPGNLEIRFLRLMVQSQLPAFLGYNNMKEDKVLLFNSFTQLNKENIPVFVHTMIRILIQSDVYSPQEKEALSKRLH